VILQFPGGAPRAPDAASAGGAAAPRPAAWLQLTRERDGIPVGDAAAVRAAEDGRGQPSPYPLAPPPPMVAACYAAHPVSCGNGLTLGGGADVATTGDALEVGRPGRACALSLRPAGCARPQAAASGVSMRRRVGARAHGRAGTAGFGKGAPLLLRSPELIQALVCDCSEL
jgi:hypothetical protein